jgi:hypothetical protein
MDRESQVLLVALMLIGIALAAMRFPREIMSPLWAFLAGAFLAWALRKPAN